MRLVLLVVGLLASSSFPAFAQIAIDHATYQPRSGESAAAFFARVQPGDPVVELPGYVWAHDGARWSQVPAGTPTPTLPTPAGPCADFNAYAASPEQILACVPRRTRPVNTMTGEPFTFEVGEVYRLPYGNYRLLVLGIVPDIGTPRRVVAGRILRAGGSLTVGTVLAFYEDAPGAWVPLMNGEAR